MKDIFVNLAVAGAVTLLVAVLLFLRSRRIAAERARLALLDPAKVPAGVLYSPGQVAFATALGAPIAGCILMAANYRKMNQARKGREILGFGLLVTGALFVIGLVFGKYLTNSALPAASIAGMWASAKQAQGAFYNEHSALGGRSESNWRVIGIGLACMFGLIAFVVLASVIAGMIVNP